MARLTRLQLIDFRNFAAADWTIGQTPVVVHGANGAGKTSLLEAISLLVPGRGLRGARLVELARRAGGKVSAGWSVGGWFDRPGGAFCLKTGVRPDAPRQRCFVIDDEPVGNQAEIAGLLSCVWLTPQMEALFLEPASGRRRFLDRLVATLEPGFARLLAAQGQVMAERLRLLRKGAAEPTWLNALEEQLARKSVALAAMRQDYAAALNLALAALPAPFPRAKLVLSCPVAERLAKAPALSVETDLRDCLRAGREADREAGNTGAGVNAADIDLRGAVRDHGAAEASTGERKALLVSVMLGQAAVLTRHRGAAPKLLLDEPMTHLDAARRHALAETLLAYDGQAFLTGTDWDQFRGLAGRCGEIGLAG